MRNARAITGLVLALAFAGAAAADRFSPAVTPPGRAVRAPVAGRVLGCPFAKSSGGSGFVHLANTARERSSVRITFVPDGAPAAVQELVLEGGRTTTVGVPSEIRPGAGAIVSSVGGEVFASTSGSVSPVVGRSGAVAASCRAASPATLVVPQGSTLGADTNVLILNPAASDAVVDVSFLVGGNEVEPESLRRRIVPAFARLVVREGDFVFDEASVAAVVRASAGRVIVAGLTTSARIVELAPAQAPALESVTVGDAARGALSFAAVGVGEEDAVLDVRALSGAGASGFAPLVAGLTARTPRVDPVPAENTGGGPVVGLAVRSRTSPVVIGARWEVAPGKGAPETAVAAGAPPAHGVTAVIGPPAQAGDVRLLVANPDRTEASVEVSLFVDAGPVGGLAPEIRTVKVAPGSALGLLLPGIPQGGTVAVSLRSAAARIVAVLETTANGPGGFGAYAVTGIPLEPPVAVAVEPDPRLGVPAP